MKKRLGKSGKRMAAAVMAAVLAFGLTACEYKSDIVDAE